MPDEEMLQEEDDSYYETESNHSECDRVDYSDLDDLIEIDDSEMISKEKREQNLISKQLADWAVSNGIKQIHLSRLLRILKETMPFLPLDARTLLKTMRYVRTKEISPGLYYHFGICEGMRRTLLFQKSMESFSKIGIIVNIDGIPLTKSTNNMFWPITGRVLEPVNGPPFIIGIYYGNKDPDDFNDLLEDSVEEVKDLCAIGFTFDSSILNFQLIGFVCDAPARAKIKSTVLHSAYFGCGKCFVKGIYYKPTEDAGGRVTFPDTNCVLRTNENFRSREQASHHHETSSVLEQLDMDMVMDFPEDEMHLLDLGVMKKILYFQKSGRYTPARLSKKKLTTLSDRIISLKPYVPVDFARKPRGLDELARWKATELHFVLMYAGIVVFNGLISEDHFKHFSLLYTSVRILSSPVLYRKRGMYTYCEARLKDFVGMAVQLYGQHFISFNVHSLIHLPKNVEHWEEYGPLYSNSAYPFENLLQTIKGLISAKRYMLQQAVKRLDEKNRNEFAKNKVEDPPIIVKEKHTQGPLITPFNGEQYGKVQLGKILLTRSLPDNVVLVCVSNEPERLTVFQIHNITKFENDEIFLIGKTFQTETDYFKYPLGSMRIHTFKVSCPIENFVSKKLSEVKFKACMLPSFIEGENSFIVSPLPMKL